MLPSILTGLVAGQRSMMPLAMLAVAARTKPSSGNRAVLSFMANPVVAIGAVTLAAGELRADKQANVPSRIAPFSIGIRVLTAALAAGTLAPRGRFMSGAAIGGLTAIAAAYAGWRSRKAGSDRIGQTASGLVEDATVIALAATALNTGEQ